MKSHLNRKIHAQRGYALATALLILVVMASLGVSMFGNVGLQEKMSGNLRVKNRSMMVADSALQSNFTYENLRSKVSNPKTVFDIADDFRIHNANGGSTQIDLGGEVSICYLGYMDATGEALDANSAGSNVVLTNHVFVAAAYAEEIATNATTTLEQGGYIKLPVPTQDVEICNPVSNGFSKESEFLAEQLRGDVAAGAAL